MNQQHHLLVGLSNCNWSGKVEYKDTVGKCAAPFLYAVFCIIKGKTTSPNLTLNLMQMQKILCLLVLFLNYFYPTWDLIQRGTSTPQNRGLFISVFSIPFTIKKKKISIHSFISICICKHIRSNSSKWLTYVPFQHQRLEEVSDYNATLDTLWSFTFTCWRIHTWLCTIGAKLKFGALIISVHFG